MKKVSLILGLRLKALREEKDLSQRELSDLVKIGNVTLSQYENNRRSPDPETLTKLADFYNVSTDYLLGRSNDRTTPPQTTEQKEIDDYFNQVAAEMDGLMFSGKPLSAESKAKVIQALRVGIEMAKQDEERQRKGESDK